MPTSIKGPLLDLGPMEVWFGVKNSETQLGNYYESVSARFSERDAMIYESAHGVTPVDCVKIGQDPMEVVVPFTRLTLALLSSAFPGANYSAGVPSYFEVKNDEIGVSEFDNSSHLILKPISGASVAAAIYWLHVEHAYPLADYEITYDTTGQRVFNTTFKSFPDPVNKRVWYIGEG